MSKMDYPDPADVERRAVQVRKTRNKTMTSHPYPNAAQRAAQGRGPKKAAGQPNSNGAVQKVKRTKKGK